MRLTLAENLIIDFEESPWNTQGFKPFICGMSGSGKSYTIAKMLEQAYREGLQFIFLDPHGEGHVLADKSFAKRGSIIVATEREGIPGVPVTPQAIPIYVDLVVSGSSLVLDLSKYFVKSKSTFNRIAEDFIRAFYAKWTDIRRPIVVAMDEAHYFAPQRKTSDSMSRVALIEELATGGRKFGIHLALSTQRPALIDKTPISQANLRLVGKLEATQDWGAVKDYVKDTVSFAEIRGLESGQFVASVAGESQIVKISRRETVDAGATPSVVTALSKTAEVELAEVAEKIREAIAAAEQETKEQTDLHQQLARANKRNEELKEKLDRLAERLDTLTFISDKMQGSTGERPTKTQKTDSWELEGLRSKISGLQKQYEAELDDRDTTISNLQHKMRALEDELDAHRSLAGALRQVLGPVANNGLNYDSLVSDVTAQVIAEIPQATQTYQIEPIEAIRAEWEQKALDSMLETIEGLPHGSLELLHYLLSVGKYQTKGAAAKAIVGNAGGSAYQQLNTWLEPLLAKDLAQDHPKQGIRATLDRFIDRTLGDEPEDRERFEKHLLARIGRLLRS